MSDGFPLAFSLPEGFRSIDLRSEPARRGDELLERLNAAMPSLTGEDALHVVLANQFLAERMIEEGVVYAASFLGRSEQDPTAASTATFTVLTREAPDLRGTSLTSVLTAIQQKRKNATARYVDLTIGRCVAVVEDDLFSSTVTITGQPTDTVRHVRQLQLIFPLADRGQLAFFALSTECTQDWDDYVRMMAEICKTIRWTEASETTSISDALDG